VAAVASHEQTDALGLLQQAGEATIVSPPLSADGERLRHRIAPPRLGEHTAEVLAEAGYSEEEVAALATAGIVRLRK
jgi:formyl-CoA transferase